MFVVTDLEADGLDPSRIHLIVCREVDNPDNVHVFERPQDNPDEFLEFNKKVSVHIGHNFIQYDRRVIFDLLGVDIPMNRVIDTLVVSRLINYQREGGHSVEAWAESHGSKKTGKDIKDWSVYTPEMRERCIADTKENLYIYEKLKRYIFDPRFKSALRTEHDLEELCYILHKNGHPFNVEAAKKLLADLQTRVAPIDKLLSEAFPPRSKLIREVHPSLTKSGSLNLKDFRFLGANPDLSQYNGGPFSRIEFAEFNPGSPKQVVERLNEAGWKPTEKTKGHLEFLKTLKRNSRTTLKKSAELKNSLKDKDSIEEKLRNFAQNGWKISEENLRTLPDSAPEGAKKLAERLVLASRISDLEEWLALVDEAGLIHGQYFGIGSWTHRMSHSNPNMANIPVAKPKNNPTEFEKYIDHINHMMRVLFYELCGYTKIGVDADGIQMRIFAHLVGDERLIKALVSGKKEDKTDIHSLHQGALGLNICRSRDAAKTFIYAWLLGAASQKVSEILECSVHEAKVAVEQFLNFYPGLAELKTKIIPADARRGYFVGLDGRLVKCDSEHKMLAGYLQNGEKVIMARAFNADYKEFSRLGLPVIFRNFVHDEHQVSVPTDDTLIKQVSDIMIGNIVRQGTELNLLCPLAAQAKTGLTWADTH